jgi:hypothetical protein
MTINTYDRRRKDKVVSTYAITYSRRNPDQLRNNIAFPLKVSTSDAELMLHSLHLLSKDPRIDCHIRKHIPSPFLRGDETPPGSLPYDALINYLVRGSRMRKICWDDGDVMYVKGVEGLCVEATDASFWFSYVSSFGEKFIEVFGEFEWSDVAYNEILEYWMFQHRAEFDITDILDPFETVFVDKSAYHDLCKALRNLCTQIEAIIGQKLFDWQERIYSSSFLLIELMEKFLAQFN